MRGCHGKETDSDNTDAIELSVLLPEELIKRMYHFCDEKGMAVQEFVADTIIEKLELAHKERRKKIRL